MADNNKLELVVETHVNEANASINSINSGLSSMEQAAGEAARGASAGIDGQTVSMVKGSTAGSLRIPSDADQRSDLKPITIPNLCRSPFRGDADRCSELMPITFG